MNEKMYGQNISLPSLDNLFSSESDRQDAKLEKVQNLRLSELFSFKDHPFQIRDDEEMQKMVDSIKDHGVLTPAIVRPRPEGGYELVSGHRRHHGCTLAGLDTMPCIVREMDDDTAVILMVDSNCQREHMPVPKYRKLCPGRFQPRIEMLFLPLFRTVMKPVLLWNCSPIELPN